ncbi:MAG: hypothetical protein ACE5JQ_14310 [Candidatus Methylomirabilales bacterium]
MMERRSLFMLIVLVLAMVIPTSGSADRGPAKETPIPIMTTATPTPIMATPTPISGDNIVCFDMSTVDEAVAGSFGPSDILCVDMSKVRGAVGDSQVIFDRLGAGNVPEHQALEGFRGELLDLMDTLEELSAELPSGYPQLSDIRSSLEVERKRIQNLTDEQLYILQSSYPDFEALKAGVRSAKSLVLAAKKGSSEQDEGPGPSLGSFTIIPTPTPVTSAPPGIVHDEAVQGNVNEETGDLYPPDWPTYVGCPKEGYPTWVSFMFMALVDASKVGEIIAEAWCKSKTVTCPGTNVQDLIDCVPQAIAKGITFALERVREGFEFCNGNVASARIQAIYEDTKIIHADLYDHDQNLTTRFNWADKFIFDFRNLNLRLNIEANLASPDDDPHALLALPRSVCISPELEALQLSEPFAPEVIAGCGLLEVVSDTVRSAIDMNQNAGQDVHNAEAEFQAAVEHYNNGEWKLAYARFRKAYRETVRP